MPNLRISTWNINSIRLRLPLLQRVFAEQNPDIVCLQETKTPDEFFPKQAIADAGYRHMVFSGMKSYNGVAILSKIPLDPITTQNWCKKSDCRSIAARLPDGTEIYNFYIPAGGDIPDESQNDKFAHKLGFVREKIQFWKKQKCAKTKRIILGDFNIAPLEHDVWSHKQLLDVVSHTPVEVDLLNKMQAANDWVDAVRHFVPEGEKLYSWWSYRNQDWKKSNRGRRLDHIWVSPNLKSNLRSHSILKEARDWKQPSDHVPVGIELKL